MNRRDGSPVWIDESRREPIPLRRADLRSQTEQHVYNEDWLQRLLHERPDVLPIEQIEPGFGRPISLCRELPLNFGGGRSGALDNIFATPTGGLVLVETKLWRNPEARRAVVAQAMEYAAAVFSLDYENLEAAVRRGRTSMGEEDRPLYDLVKRYSEDLEESEFVDAVSRNLKRGRAIIAVVGDGIREDIAPLAALLQSHAGHRFTFALVELAVYGTPQPGVRLVVPSVLAQTAMIERGVVMIEDSGEGKPRIAVREPLPQPAGSSQQRAFGIGEDEFYDLLDQREAGSAKLLKEFLNKAETIGVTAERQRGLNLKHASPSGNDLNLGTIDKGGFVDTGPTTWWGRTEFGRKYNDTLANAIGGTTRVMKSGKEFGVRTAAGKMPRLTDFLPSHEQVWLDAMSQYIKDMFDAAKES